MTALVGHWTAATTFRCDDCEQTVPLKRGDRLNGYHDAGLHLCPSCDTRLMWAEARRNKESAA